MTQIKDCLAKFCDFLKAIDCLPVKRYLIYFTLYGTKSRHLIFYGVEVSEIVHS